jgi:hypothetical protein
MQRISPVSPSEAKQEDCPVCPAGPDQPCDGTVVRAFDGIHIARLLAAERARLTATAR